MPKKPTRRFGVFVFPKEGGVYPKFDILPANKDEQEVSVVERFTRRLSGLPEGYAVEGLDENDHDAAIVTSSGNRHATVQCTEVSIHQFARRLSQEEYNRGRNPFVFMRAPNEPWGVDLVKARSAIWDVIQKKLKKHYSRPAHGEFWLLVYCVEPLPEMYPVSENGRPRPGDILKYAQERLQEEGSDPFDRVYFFPMIMPPVRIWPLEDRGGS